MDIDDLAHEVMLSQARIDALKDDHTAPRSSQGVLVPELFEELHLSLEELRVAEEEMRQQNDELANSRERVEQERKRYQDLFNFAPDGYIVTDMMGTIREANTAAARMLGVAANRLTRKPLPVYIALKARPAFREFLQRATEKNAVQEEFETILQPRHAAQYPAALTVGAQRDRTGAVTELRWLLRDVTERRQWETRLQELNENLERLVAERTAELAAANQAQKELLEREQQAHAEAEAARTEVTEILESIQDAFYAVDREFRFTYVNRQAELWWGRTREELIGRDYWTVFPISVGSESQQRHQQAMAEHRPIHFETFSPLIHRWIEYHIFPTERGLSVYFRDIQDRKQTEEARGRELEHNRNIADTLQTALMQSVSENAFPGLSLATLYKAASDEAKVGGDFFDAFTVGEGRVALVVGDVSGKGLLAATHVAEVKYALRAILRETPTPSRALARLNDFVCEAQRHDDWGSASLVVLALVIIDPSCGEVVYSSAGSEPLLLLPPDSEVVEEHGQGSGVVLGVRPGRSYQETQLRLPPGGMLLMATDGITEARQGRQMLGLAGLKRLMNANRHEESVGQISRAILEGATEFAGGVLSDDACLLLARWHPGQK